jgi:hypothetical protein
MDALSVAFHFKTDSLLLTRKQAIPRKTGPARMTGNKSPERLKTLGASSAVSGLNGECELRAIRSNQRKKLFV